MTLSDLITPPCTLDDIYRGHHSTGPVDRVRVEAAVQALLSLAGTPKAAGFLVTWVPSPLAGTSLACALLSRPDPRQNRSRRMAGWCRMVEAILPRAMPLEFSPLDHVCHYWDGIPEYVGTDPGILWSSYNPALDLIGRMAERCGSEAWPPSVCGRYGAASPAMWGQHGVHAVHFRWWRHLHPGFGLVRTILSNCPYWWVLPRTVLLCERPVVVEGDVETVLNVDRNWRIGYRDGFGAEYRGRKIQPWSPPN